MKKTLFLLLLSAYSFAQTGKPQVIDNMATPTFKGVNIRKQTTIGTPTLGITIGNVGGRIVSKDSLGVLKQYLISTDVSGAYMPLSGGKFIGTVEFANSSSTSNYTKISPIFSSTGNLAVASLNYETKFGASTISWQPIRMSSDGYVGIGKDPTFPLDVIGYSNFGSTAYFGTGISATYATANTIASFDGSKNLISLSTATYPSLTELSYLKGITGSIMTLLSEKQNALTNPVTATGTTDYLPKFTGASTIGNSTVYENSGNVAIGGTFAIEQLNVSSASAGRMAIDDAGGTNRYSLLFQSPTSTNQYGLIRAYKYGTGAGYKNLVLQDGGGNVSIGTINGSQKLSVNGNIRIVGNNNIRWGQGFQYIQADTTASTLHFGSNGANNMSLVNGSFGIGIASPQKKLDVADVVRSTTSYAGFEAIHSTLASWRWTLNDDNKYYLQRSSDKFVANAVTSLVADNNGNIGIGTTIPSNLLQLEGGGSNRRLLATTTNNIYPVAEFNANSTGYAGDVVQISTSLSNSGRYLNIIDNSAVGVFQVLGNKNVIVNQGNVGIGTTTPEQQLSISKASGNKVGLFLEQQSVQAWRIGMQAGSPSLIFDNTTNDFSASKMAITTDGKVGIGIYSPTEKLEVIGNAKFQHLIGNTSSPTIAAGTGAGTSPTVSITKGTDLSGVINVTTGTLPTLSATVVTVTFNVAYSSAPKVILKEANGNAAMLNGVNMVVVDDANTTTTTFQITAGTTALAASTSYKWYYTVSQ